MFRKSWLVILHIALVTAFILGLSMPMASVRAVEDQSLYIHLRAGTFDPLAAGLDIPPSLTYNPAQVEQGETYLLQFTGPVLDEWKAALEAAGAAIGPYVPDYAFLVHLDAQARSTVSGLPFVRWVGPFQPAYKLAPEMDYSKRSYRVILAPWADKVAAGMELTAFSPQVAEQENGFTAVLDEQGIQQVAMLYEVIWIEPIHLMSLHNDVGGGTIMGGSTAWSRGYDGSGVSIAVADTGLDTGVIATVHNDFTGRVANIASWPVQSIDWGCGVPVNVGADDGPADVESGHGTHVTGSVAGNGARSSGAIKGLAYAATINFQAIEQFTDWPPACTTLGLYDGRYLTGIPDDTRTLLNQAYNWGARVHNNSWGGGNAGVYDQQAAYFDDFLSSHRDMAVTVSAGNSGEDGDANGYVDLNSVSSPASAKNVITIGASDNERASGGYASDVWGSLWGSSFPAPPTSNDLTSDSRNELAAFSSRGPMADGRIKPDLVAPGTNILSTKSSQTTETGWGPYNAFYTYMGGTSMASPLSAGAAAVVREFLISSKGIANPSAALVKGALINSAVDISGYGNPSQEAGQPIPNMHEGWGRIDVAAATAPTGRGFTDNTTGLSTAGTAVSTYNILAGTPLKVSLVWTDQDAAPLAGTTLVNNLDLTVTAPGGATTYKGNVFSGGWTTGNSGTADVVNNVENVYIQSPAAGTWTVTVTGANVPQGPQPFALVVSANFPPVVFPNLYFLPHILRSPIMGAPNLNAISPNPSNGSYTLSWTPTGDTPNSYDIEENSVVTVTSHLTTFYSYTGKPVGTYTYRVRGRYGAALGPWSAPQSVTVILPTVVVNPGFESGQLNGWSEGSTHNWAIVVNSGGVAPHAGSWKAWLGGDYLDTSYIQQSITIRSGDAILSYYYWVASEETACTNDYGYVRVNGSTVFTQNLCATTNTGGWVERRLDFSAYAGQTVTLRFEVVTNGTNNSNLFIDDVDFVATLSGGLSSEQAPMRIVESAAEPRQR